MMSGFLGGNSPIPSILLNQSLQIDFSVREERPPASELDSKEKVDVQPLPLDLL
jgi:hypothetical protein